MKGNKKLSQVGTSPVEHCENIDSRLVESTDELSRSMHMVSNKKLDKNLSLNLSVEGLTRSRSLIASRATYVEPNTYSSEIKMSDLKYVQSIREEFMERERQLRKDMQAQFEELKKSMSGNEEKQISQ